MTRYGREGERGAGNVKQGEPPEDWITWACLRQVGAKLSR